MAAEEGEVINCCNNAEWTVQIDKAKQSNKLTVVFFTTSYSIPKLETVQKFVDLAIKFKSSAIFMHMNAQKVEKAAREFGVEKLVTFVFIKDGNVVDNFVTEDMEFLEATIVKHTAGPSA